jgi:hypothetical protein
MSIYRLNLKRMRAGIAALLVLAATAAGAREDTLPTRIQVAFAPDQQLSEVKNNPSWRGWMKPADWEKALSEHLRKRADRLLPPGEQLQVTINDIKLAGDYEPWRGPNFQDVRFMKDLYPPRMDLHYRLLGTDGRVIREGDSKLRDLAYLQRTSVPFNTDPLRYDKRLLDDWLNREFVRAQAGR